MEADAIPGKSEDNYFNPKSVYAYLKEKETSEKAIQLIKEFVSECRESEKKNNKNPDDNICDSDCKNCINHGYYHQDFYYFSFLILCTH